MESPKANSDSAGEKVAAPATIRRRVLVADDNVDSAESLAMLLSLMGHEVEVAHDGSAAVELAGEYRPEVILLDIGMPKLNGYEAARRIRDQIWGKSAVIVALTGWGQDDDKRKAEEAGFDHHFTKPVAPGTLEMLLADAGPVGANQSQGRR